MVSFFDIGSSFPVRRMITFCLKPMLFKQDFFSKFERNSFKNMKTFKQLEYSQKSVSSMHIRKFSFRGLSLHVQTPSGISN